MIFMRPVGKVTPDRDNVWVQTEIEHRRQPERSEQKTLCKSARSGEPREDFLASFSLQGLFDDLKLVAYRRPPNKITRSSTAFLSRLFFDIYFGYTNYNIQLRCYAMVSDTLFQSP